jgi:sporulation protein YlmC with PRC-barrel domain
MPTMHDPADTEGRLIAASKVTGTNVYNLAGESLGSIYDVMLSKATGRAEYAIMSFGGFLGMGKSYHPLPWRVLSYDAVKDGYVISMDAERLKAAPSYSLTDATDVWVDPTYASRVNDYYR